MRVEHFVVHSAQKFGFDITLSQQMFYMAQAQRKAKISSYMLPIESTSIS